MSFDARTERHLLSLLPRAEAAARRFVVAAKAMLPPNIDIQIIAGTRTFAEQNALYAQGRTKPGFIVTKARGGHSYHNFGLAWDIGLFSGRKYLTASPWYDRLGALAKDHRLTWGGDWKTLRDTPHYQVRVKATLAQMRAIVQKSGGEITRPQARQAIDALINT